MQSLSLKRRGNLKKIVNPKTMIKGNKRRVKNFRVALEPKEGLKKIKIGKN